MTDANAGSPIDRREYLSIAGAMTLGGAATRTAVAGRGTETSAGPCEEVERLETERDAKRERLEGILDRITTLREERAAIESEVERVRRETRNRRVRFPESVRGKAEEVGSEIRDSVVSFGYGGLAYGWFVAENVVATSWSVASQVRSIPGRLPNGTPFEWDVLETSEALDLALLEAEVAGDPLPTGDSTALSSGDRLVGFTRDPRFDRGFVTLGEFARRDESYDQSVLLSDVPTLADASGGAPTVTTDGDVVGMTLPMGPWPDDLPEYLERDVYPEPLPNVLRIVHLPIETIRDRLEAWT